MATINFRQSMLTGTTFNALRDSIYEFMTAPAVIRIGMHADGNLVLATINSGPDTLAEESMIPFSAAELMPVDPDEFLWEDEVAYGDRLKILIRNTNAGTRIVNGCVKIQPLA